jgi:indolepyruvate ferredoxin oxidoreductase
LQELVAKRVARLTDYQNATYAERYQAFVQRIQLAESPLGKTSISETVARHLYKLMAYKDEYEVARLHTETDFLQRIGDRFEGDFKVHYHLAPPLLAKRNNKGELVKQKYGPGMVYAFKILAKLKRLRGTAFDVFGYSEERQTERALIGEYMQNMDDLLQGLNAGNHSHALEVAKVPEIIKGYGHVKERNIRAARTLWASLTKP